MHWEGITAVVAVVGLLANFAVMVLMRVWRDGRSTSHLEASETRLTKIESDMDELEKRVTHCAKNIAILDERTLVIRSHKGD